MGGQDEVSSEIRLSEANRSLERRARELALELLADTLHEIETKLRVQRLRARQPVRKVGA